MQIYIVHFTTGEYSDRSDRVDGVFDSKEKADRYLKEMTAALNELGLNNGIGGNESNIGNSELRNSEEVLMRFGRIDYTGARYYIEGPFDLQ
jgi:hypothetical protein